jgi:signal transduction histidine kinase
VTRELRAFLFSFETKLVFAFTSVIVLAILISGSVLVLRSRDDRRAAALDRVAAASPAIYQQTFLAFVQSDSQTPFDESLDELADEQDVRIIILGSDDVVVYDTQEELRGRNLDVPASTFKDVQRGFVAWEPADSFAEGDVTLLSASSRFTFGPGREIPFRVVLAVESDTIADAWLGVLPGLGLAALVAVPLSGLVGAALARQVAHPVRRLTAASEAMARGEFDQRVAIERDDEIGRLSRAFSAMAERVGQRDAQMRSLLANVSHDLKTPMTSITGYAQSLGDGTASPEDTGRIGEVIREEAEHVNRLLGDLLYLAEIDAGEVIRRKEDVDLAILLGRCVRRIEPSARDRDIDITFDASGLAVLRGVDGEKLERAFSNVLDNAAKFCTGGGTIAVRARHENGRVVVETTNSGEAVAEGELARLFDRFFRGDRARRTVGGSGLGLAITKELVELHGGTVEASNTDAGVRFTIMLPAGPATPSVLT